MDMTERLPATQEHAQAGGREGAPKQSSFEQRFAEALRRRLYPNTPLRLKTLSRDTGYSEDTVTRWTQAKHRVFAGAVEDLATYFASRFGDDALLREVFVGIGGSALATAPAQHHGWAIEARRVVPAGQFGNGQLAGEESVHL